jgi:lactate dehydrogenase-like 2-hydroxyacid dehydrogenase
MPGVAISPHMARTVPGTNRLRCTVTAEQINAFLRGEEPLNVVHR